MKDKSKKKIEGKSKKVDDLAQMKKDYDAMKRRAEGGGGGKTDTIWDKQIEGKNLRRILPIPGQEGSIYYVVGHQHFRVGPDGKATVRCIAKKEHFDGSGRPQSGTPCPICKRFLKEQARINSEYKKGDEEGRTLWRKAKEAYCPRTRYLMNALTPEGDVRVFGAGEQIMLQLQGYFVEEDSDVGDFTSLTDGRWMNIKRVGMDRHTKYTVRPGTETQDISDQWDEIKGMLHDLDKAAGELLSADQILAILKGIKHAEDEEADEDDDDE